MRKLLLVFALTGCTAQGYVKADAISDSLNAVCDRHDDYVNKDPDYDNPDSPKKGQRASDLRETKLLRQLVKEAQAKPKPTPSPAK